MNLPLNALTPRMRQVLLSAASQATSHEQRHIGTEHVLLALAQDENGLASQALRRLGVRQQVIATMEQVVADLGPTGEAGNIADAAVVDFDPKPNHALRLRT